jgi:hypothetical protein
MMDCVIENHGFSCFGPDVFSINGVDGDLSDFGTMQDWCPAFAPEYGCGNMQFFRKGVDPLVLKKYHIDEDDYYCVCDRLSEVMNIGQCALCS